MNRETGNVLLGFLVGAVAGGVAALLFAPASGKETRQKIVDGLGRTRDKLNEEIASARDRMNEEIENARDKMNEEIEQAMAYAKVHKEAVKEGFHEGKEAYKRVVGKGEA